MMRTNFPLPPDQTFSLPRLRLESEQRFRQDGWSCGLQIFEAAPLVIKILDDIYENYSSMVHTMRMSHSFPELMQP